MARWDETALMAYVDGELDAETARAIEASLPNDPEARALVAQYRLSATAAGRAFDGSLCLSVPPALLRAAGVGDTQPVQLAAERRIRRPGIASRRVWLPLAASLAAVAVGLAGYGVWKNQNAPTVHLAGSGPSLADQRFEGALLSALNQSDDHKSVTYTVPGAEHPGRVTLLGPVATPLGLPCRAFVDAPAQSDRPPMGGVACRAPDGSWNVLTSPIPPSSSR